MATDLINDTLRYDFFKLRIVSNLRGMPDDHKLHVFHVLGLNGIYKDKDWEAFSCTQYELIIRLYPLTEDIMHESVTNQGD